MGDVVPLCRTGRSRPAGGGTTDPEVTGVVVLFTGVRIERWREAEPEVVAEPRDRPDPPRRRRRRS